MQVEIVKMQNLPIHYSCSGIYVNGSIRRKTYAATNTIATYGSGTLL